MPQSLASLHFHLIFSTKNREPTISPELSQSLYNYFGGILKNNRGCLLAARGTLDHVHLLASLHREMSIAEALRLLKCNSSKWIHETRPDQGSFSWQTGYGAFAVSYSNLNTVKRYIARQEEHHRKRTFQDEFREFLRRHDIEWDEQYVWD